MRAPVAACLSLLVAPALAQESGWHYSPLPGEGDRAALGCAYGATATSYVCLAVRCEDDFTTGLYVHTSRPGGDTGRWRLEFDEVMDFTVEAVPDDAPYHARVGGDVAPILAALKTGSLVYLDPQSGEEIEKRAISLSGSLQAINQANYFCAPRSLDAPAGTESQ